MAPPFLSHRWLPRTRLALTRAIQRTRLKRRIAVCQSLRIALGAGAVLAPGWIATDLDLLDITKPEDWRRLFAPSSIDALLAEHVWEHLEPEAARAAAGNCFAFLKVGGYLRVAVPDGLHPDPKYREWVRPGGHGPGAHDHKILYDYRSFSSIFASCGFRVNLLEYFDETGAFIYKSWDASGGMVHRSSRFDRRNGDGTLRYTSIVLDALKETG